MERCLMKDAPTLVYDLCIVRSVGLREKKEDRKKNCQRETKATDGKEIYELSELNPA